MADEDQNESPETGEDGGTEKVKKKGLSGKVLILFILLPLLLIGGGVGGAYFAGVFDSEEVAEEEQEPVEEEVEKVVVFYDMPDMLVNLSSSTSDASFLKLSVSLELDDETVLPELEKLMPRVMDNFQVYLRELRREDLAGSAGTYRLKEELLYRINTSVNPIQVKDVLFKEMLVQ
ncbi:flagellar basal body-associated FliL family protein [Sneathiella limimaris]|uniref:flagellar basal body-associated FliL family protein n=1 Tax=Sneathiella limimaris TaxID=1964213 RepID=UPI00146AA8CB|nr:flagellar basal body-associated FliL family protein [Sneathiella limimaris]